jgi:hypothetical protein
MKRFVEGLDRDQSTLFAGRMRRVLGSEMQGFLSI